MKAGGLRRAVAWLLCAMMIFACVPQGFADATPGEAAQEVQQTTDGNGGQNTGTEENGTDGSGTDTDDVDADDTDTDGVNAGSTDTSSTDTSSTGTGSTDTNDGGSGGISPYAVGDTGDGCPHAHTRTYEHYVGPKLNVAGVDAYTHTYTQQYVRSTECLDCYAIVGEDAVIDEAATVTEYHIFNDSGVCRICKYSRTEDDTCGHPADQIFEETVFESGGRPVSVGKSAHYYPNGAQVTYRVCGVCGEHIEVISSTPDTHTEPHEMEDGVCIDCGEAECGHGGETYSDTVRETEVVTSSAATHTLCVNEWSVVKCSDCGQILSYEKTKEDEISEEPHTFRENGKCSVCMAECPHENLNITRGLSTWGELVSSTEKGHTYSRDIIETAVCADCGKTVRQNEVVEENVSVTDTHEFGSDGLCMTCGFALADMTCPHASQTTETEYSERGCLPYDETSHIATLIPVTMTYCLDCGSWLSTVEGEEKTELMPHHFDNGVCDCGYENPCVHENKIVEMEGNRMHNCEYADINTHTYLADEVEIVLCADCGEQLSSRVVRTDVTYTEAHTYDWTGACIGCGAQKHEHQASDSEARLENLRDYQPKDENTHTYIADEWTKTVCSCGEVLSDALTKANVSLEEKHTFGEDGRCTLCGQCSHAQTRKESTPIEGTEKITNNNDGKTHTRTWSVTVATYCTVCGEKLGETTEQESEILNHDHSSGACVCGEPCPHAHQQVTQKSLDSDQKIVASDEAGHTCSIDLRETAVCLDCGDTIREGEIVEEDVLFRGHHIFNADGICVECGFKQEDVTCPHEHLSESVTYRADGEPISIDASGHTMTVIPYTYLFCEDCGAVMTTVGERVVETLAHNFSYSSTCADCGYVNTCEHEHTTATTTFRNARHYATAGDDTHTFVADTWEVVTCDDCGEELSATLIKPDAAYTREHAYNWQGVCFDCGAVKPVPPTPKPTSTPTPAPTPAPEVTYVPTSKPAAVRTAEPTVEPTVAPTPEPEKQEIVSALTEALTEAEEEGKEVKVEIVGAQEVLTQNEYSTLTTLSAQEQVLVVLQSIGLGDVASAAVSTMNVTLSDEAQALMSQVSERVQVLTVEERAAYEEKLAEYFPMTERVVNGVTRRCFTVDVRITVDGVERVESYQFYLDENGEWIFERVDLKSIGAETQAENEAETPAP